MLAPCGRVRNARPAAITIGVLTLGALCVERTCRAENGAPTPPDRMGLAVHTEVGLALLEPGASGESERTPAMAAVGVGIGVRVAPHVEVELTVSDTPSGSRLVMAPGGGSETFESTVGLLWRGLVHYHRSETGGGWHLGAGPTLVTSGNFGTVPLRHVEGGWEWRAPSGFQVLVAAQLMEPLMLSQPEIDASRCFTQDCPSRFNPGRPVFGTRAAVGFVF